MPNLPDQFFESDLGSGKLGGDVYCSRIYCHPIYIAAKDQSNNSIRVLMLTFNTISTPYTSSNIKQLIDDICRTGGRILTSGRYEVNSKYYTPYMFSFAYGNTLLYYCSENTTGEVNLTDLTISDVLDGANPIN